jgi:hypothetical protein
MIKFIIAFFLFSNVVFGKNTDTTAVSFPTKNEFSFNNFFKTKDIYLGNYDTSSNNLLLNAEIKYWFKFGLYFAVAPDFVFGGKKKEHTLSDIGFTVGYDQYFGENDEWNAYGYYTFYWQNMNAKAKSLKQFKRFRNLQNHNITVGGSWENIFIKPAIELNYMFGDTVVDAVLSLTISKPIYIFDDEQKGTFYVEPFILNNFGTANNVLTYENRKIRTDDVAQMLNTEFGVNVHYEKGYIEIEPSFIFSHSYRQYNFLSDLQNVGYGAIMVRLKF